MKKMTLETNAAALKRWRSKLKRAMTAIEKLERQRKRLEIAARDDLAVVPKGATRPKAAPPPPLPAPGQEFGQVNNPIVPDDLAIPDFLQRKPDPVAEQIKAEQEENKKAKARGRIEKMKAKKRGDLKKMPLTGKAALEAIRNA